MLTALTTTMLTTMTKSSSSSEASARSVAPAHWVEHRRSLKNSHAEEDGTITCVELSDDGSLCAIGDKAGRVLVVAAADEERVVGFKSHDAEFDYLKSLEIEEKINKIRFCRSGGPCPMLLSTNDKTIKLWKITTERRRPEAKVAVAKRVFGSAHAYHINSISINSDGETFCSSDDLRINLWNLEVSNKAFNIVDLKPTSMDDLAEVITCTCFHPTRCADLMFATSKGNCKLFDIRSSARCGQPVACLPASPFDSFLGEVVANVADCKFVGDTDLVCARDFLNLRIFDLRMADQPVAAVPVHDHLVPKLNELYDSDRIFDKFEVVHAYPSFFTGSYSAACLAFDHDRNLDATVLPPRSPLPSPSNTDFDRRCLHLAAHDDTLVAAEADILHFFDLHRRPRSSRSHDDLI